LLWVIPSLLVFSWLLLTRLKAIRGLFGRSKTIAVRVLIIGAALLTSAVFFLTQSRGGYIALALTLPVLIIIALPRKARRYSLAILAALVIVLAILAASHWGIVLGSVMGNSIAADPALSLDSLGARLEIWSRAIYGIQDFPFTGMGINTFRTVMPELYPVFTIPAGVDIAHAHNEFLLAALDLGIPGSIAFITLNIVAFWMLIRTWKYSFNKAQSKPDGKPTWIVPDRLVGWFSIMQVSPLADSRLTRILVLGWEVVCLPTCSGV
jgi:O-antigen ligase